MMRWLMIQVILQLMSQSLWEDWQHSVYATDDYELKEALPSYRPEPRGKGMTMQLYVDSDHAGDVKNTKGWELVL